MIRAAALLLAAGAPTDAPAQSQAPAGWTVTERTEAAETFRSPDGRDEVTVAMFGDNGVDLDALVASMTGTLAGMGCDGVAQAEPVASPDRRASWIRTESRTCGVIAGRTFGNVTMVICRCSPRPAAGEQAAVAIARRLFGALPAPSPRAPSAAVDQPVAGRGSVPSADLTGVWTALVDRTVYDPVMAIRWERAVAYLVLTPGGSFSTEIVRGQRLDDAGIAAWAREHPEEAGRYSIAGDRLLLRFASGKTKAATMKGSGMARRYLLDQADYKPMRRFPDGATLSGIYTNGSVTQVGAGMFVTGDHDFTFTPDGRFARGGQVTSTGSGYAIVGGSDRRGGRYHVAGGALHLDYHDGRQEVVSMWQERPGEAIWFDGAMYKPAGGD